MLCFHIFSSEYKDFIKADYFRREAGRVSWKEMEAKIQKLFNKIIPEVFPDEKTRRKYYNSSKLYSYLHASRWHMDEETRRVYYIRYLHFINK